jgi:acyl-CoA thioester hydrolase
MGHFTIRYYMAMFDDAAWSFFIDAGFDPEFMSRENIGWADVHHEIDYFRELLGGEHVVIETRPVRIGNKSMVLQFDMKREGEDDSCARLTATTLQFDLEKRRAIPILPHIRERILDWLE